MSLYNSPDKSKITSRYLSTLIDGMMIKNEVIRLNHSNKNSMNFDSKRKSFNKETFS